MDKQEYREIVADIKRTHETQEYEKLLMYADELEIRRISDARVLEMIADAYEATGQTDEAVQILTRAYEKTPMGRKMAYKLGELAVKQGDLDKAVEYYEEFSRMAPNDNSRLLLKYKIGKAGNVDKKDLARVLDAYCSKEMDDRWMYELALLYDEMGEKEKSAEICNDIILWFAGGEYIEKAAALQDKTGGAKDPVTAAVPKAMSEEKAGEAVDEVRDLRPQAPEAELADAELDSILEEYITLEDATTEPQPSEMEKTKVIPVDEIRKHVALEPATPEAQAGKFAYSAENMPGIEEDDIEEITGEAQTEALQPQALTEEEDGPGAEADNETDSESEVRSDDQLFRAVTENGKPFSNIIAMNSARTAPPKEEGDFWKMPDELSLEEKEGDPDEPVFGSHRWFEEKSDEPEFEEPVYGAHRFAKNADDAQDGDAEGLQEEEIPAGEEETISEEFTIEEIEPEPIKIEHPKTDNGITGRISTIKTAAGNAAFGADIYTAADISEAEGAEPDEDGAEMKPEAGQHKYEEIEAEQELIKDEPASEPVTEPEPPAEEFAAEPEPVEEDKPFLLHVMPNQPLEEKVPESVRYEEARAREESKKTVPDASVFAKHFEPEPDKPEPVSEGAEPIAEPEQMAEPESVAEVIEEPAAEEPAEEPAKEERFLDREPNARAMRLFMEEKEAEVLFFEEEPKEAAPEKEPQLFVFPTQTESAESAKDYDGPEPDGFEKAMRIFENSQIGTAGPVPGELEAVLNDVVEEANKPWEEPEFGLPDTDNFGFGAPEPESVSLEEEEETPWDISDDELAELTGAGKEPEKKPEPVLAPPIEVTQRIRPVRRQNGEDRRREEPERQKEVTQRVRRSRREEGKIIAEEEKAKDKLLAMIEAAEADTELFVPEPAEEILPEMTDADGDDMYPAAADEPFVPEPFTEDMFTDDLFEAEAAVEEPVIEEPVIEEPVLDDTFVPEPVIEEPAVEDFIPEDGADAAAEPVAGVIAEEEFAEEMPGYSIPEELREEFSEFLIIDGMEERICRTIADIVDRKLSGDASGGNLIVTGDPKSGKTYLIIAIIKAIGKETGSSAGKVAKVQAEALNGKDMNKVFSKLSGSDLVIENSGYLNDDTVESLINAMKKDNNRAMVILEGNSLGVENIMVKHPEMETLFHTRLDLDELSLAQWADLACEYAQEKGYSIGDMALLALHARIDELNLPTTRLVVEDVQGIVDEAIEKARKKGGGRRRHKKNKDNITELEEADFM